MAIKINKELTDFIQLISNIFDTYTTALFLFDKKSNMLKLNYHYSLGENIKNDIVINIGKSLKTWLINFKKPIEIKDNNENEFFTLLKIYKKKENVKTFFAVSIGNYEGLLYVDTKKSYSLPEKHQKLLKHCSQIISQFLKIEKAARDIKYLIDYSRVASVFKREVHRLDKEVYSIDQIIEIISNLLGFEYGCFFQNNYNGNFKLIGTNLYSIQKLKNRTFENLNTVVGAYFSKEVRNSKFVIYNKSDTIFFYEKEDLKKDKLENFWYFPFINGNNIIGAFFFFNFKKEYNFDKLFLHLYDAFYPIVYEIIVKSQIDSLVRYEPFSGLMRDVYFLDYLGKQNFLNSGLIFIEIKNLSKILKRNSLKNILKSYRVLKRSIDNVLDSETVGGFFSLGKLGILYSETNLKELQKKKVLLIKNFENRIINVENKEITLDLKLEIFNNVISSKNDILKKIN